MSRRIGGPKGQLQVSKLQASRATCIGGLAARRANHKSAQGRAAAQARRSAALGNSRTNTKP